jgi:hypothetical protein
MNLSPEGSPLLPVIDSGEELLRRAHATAQAIQERVWKAMGQHELSGPHGPAEAADPGPSGAGEGGN